jgi:trans-aconitate methyltransferase
VNPYDEVPYPSHAFAQTHPRRLAAMARLFGMTPPDPGASAVLELGCASGGNLIPLAAANPGATFVGVDYGARHIDAARAWAAHLGLSNIRFEQADLRSWSPHGTFDYVLCHGVYSWVPDDVRTAIFRLIRSHLSASGVAYVSYNALPGWHMFGIIRETMLFFARKGGTPSERVAAGRAALEFLAASVPASQGGYARLLQDAVEMIAGHADEYLFHEYLEENNDPTWFHEFAARAAGHGLQYLGESNLSAMLDHTLGTVISERFRSEARGIVDLEQYMDVLRNRTFRQTLLVRRECGLERDLSRAPLDELFGSCGGSVTPEADGTWTLSGDGAAAVSTEDADVAAALVGLCAAWPRGVPLSTFLEGGDEERRRVVRDGLLAALSVRLIDLAVGPFSCAPVAMVPDRPRAFATAAALAAHTPRVPNLRNESFDLDPLDQQILPLLDGTRSVDDVVDALFDRELGDGPDRSLVQSRLNALCGLGLLEMETPG